MFSVCSVYEIKDGGMCRKEEGGEEESDMEVGGIWAEMEISRLFSFFPCMRRDPSLPRPCPAKSVWGTVQAELQVGPSESGSCHALPRGQ